MTAATGRLAGRSLRLPVICPAAAKVACRGRLTVRRAGRVAGAISYALPLGGRAMVAVTVAGSLRRGQAVRVTLRERGASAKGPRRSVRVVTVR